MFHREKAWTSFIYFIGWLEMRSEETVLVNYNTTDSLSNCPRAVPKLKL